MIRKYPWLLRFCGTAGLLLLAAALLACRSPGGRQMTEEDMIPTVLVLSPGDLLDITFPGATNFTGLRKIGPEGEVTMPIVGQVQASGKTAAQLESELEQLYAKELQDNDIVVTVAGSANAVYVTGAVMRPGRITMDRPMTALEAILECGGFAPDANMKKVTVVRYVGEHNTIYNLNMEPIYSGGPVPPFYLKPRDAIHVAQKVQWF